VAWRVVMTQQPVLRIPLVWYFLPTASIKTLSTPAQNCWFKGWHWRKKTPSEKLPNSSRTQTTCPWSLFQLLQLS